MAKSNITPMMHQYESMKRQYPACILLFRVGDFYETFGEDAKTASKALDIVLTSRGKGETAVPLAGIPYHAAESYISKLLKQGFKVAVCEQVEDPKYAKGIVKREVTKVITPGTVISESMLSGKDINYLAGIHCSNEGYGLALADISTGEFLMFQYDSEQAYEKIMDDIHRFKPVECLLSDSLSKDEKLIIDMKKKFPDILTTKRPVQYFENAEEKLLEHFQVLSLKCFGITDKTSGMKAARAIIRYLEETQMQKLTHFTKIQYLEGSNHMIIDNITQKNLELTENLRDGSIRGTLLEVLDDTITAMGKRLLRTWIHTPLIDVKQIRQRLDAVEEFSNHYFKRDDLRRLLREVRDIDRLISRVAYGCATPKDLIGLKISISQLPPIKKVIAESVCEKLNYLSTRLDDLSEIVALLDQAIVNDPPATVSKGDFIKHGYDSLLDELRSSFKNAKKWVVDLEAQERNLTGIRSLKVRYNQVFGYYIEVTKPNINLVPNRYIRKQTITNAERFYTQELKEKEEFILNAEQQYQDRETELFNQICEKITQEINRVRNVSQVIAQLDVLSSFAQITIINKYQKPEVEESNTIAIKNGRHPVIEKFLDANRFIPNDITIDCENQQILIITGPNMSGKSTYLRQVALITLMAQMGCFVSAESAKIGVVDRIFSRVGATDDISSGHSTFMVEMLETANILNNATKNSLIILDEVGRGTSTYDGMSIAWAIVEYLHNLVMAKTLFSTHYHHLNELASVLPRVRNYNIPVLEKDGGIVFLHKIVPGGTERSYGIHVAKLAGLPLAVIKRANDVLDVVRGESAAFTKDIDQHPQIRNPDKEDERKDYEESEVLKKLRDIPVEEITPIQALNTLAELKAKYLKKYRT